MSALPTVSPAAQQTGQPGGPSSVAPTAVVLRPGHEGANIRTWIGFKHFMYLAEDAVLTWFRERGTGPGQLFHEHGLGLSLVDSSVQLPSVLDVDDVVASEVTGGPEAFVVRLRAQRPGTPSVLRGRLRVALVRQHPPGAAPGDPAVQLPAGLRGLVVDDVADLRRPDRADLALDEGADPATVVAAAAGGGFVWTWRVPYFYCQQSLRLQHSGYVRAMEEVVDRLLADRGLSVRTLLDQRSWIPVVSRARVTLLADAQMEETMYTVLTITEVLRATSFDARMDCYVRRGDRLVHTATGRIMHAYAIAAGPGAGGLAELDDAVIGALIGAGPC
jgi:acyl-CoA thioesterase FadM